MDVSRGWSGGASGVDGGRCGVRDREGGQEDVVGRSGGVVESGDMNWHWAVG